MFSNKKMEYFNFVCLAVVTISAALVQTTQAQAYLLTLSQNPSFHAYPYPYQPSSQASRRNTNPLTSDREDNRAFNQANSSDLEDDDDVFVQDDDSTIYFVKNTNSSEFSQSAMDVITIVWYVATFLALAAFFLLMVCSDKCCCASNRNPSNDNNNNDTTVKPPTPSPSYSQFAPPSYETVIKMQNPLKATIFVIPTISNYKEDGRGKQSNYNNNSSNNLADQLNFYTINELPKMGDNKSTNNNS